MHKGEQWEVRLEGWGGVKLYKALNAKVRSFLANLVGNGELIQSFRAAEED